MRGEKAGGFTGVIPDILTLVTGGVGTAVDMDNGLGLLAGLGGWRMRREGRVRVLSFV